MVVANALVVVEVKNAYVLAEDFYNSLGRGNPECLCLMGVSGIDAYRLILCVESVKLLHKLIGICKKLNVPASTKSGRAKGFIGDIYLILICRGNHLIENSRRNLVYNLGGLYANQARVGKMNYAGGCTEHCRCLEVELADLYRVIIVLLVVHTVYSGSAVSLRNLELVIVEHLTYIIKMRTEFVLGCGVNARVQSVCHQVEVYSVKAAPFNQLKSLFKTVSLYDRAATNSDFSHNPSLFLKFDLWKLTLKIAASVNEFSEVSSGKSCKILLVFA